MGGGGGEGEMIEMKNIYPFVSGKLVVGNDIKARLGSRQNLISMCGISLLGCLRLFGITSGNLIPCSGVWQTGGGQRHQGVPGQPAERGEHVGQSGARRAW